MDRYAKTFTVRWADCDANGHMRNTAYSEYCIDVRVGFLAEHGFPWKAFRDQGVGPVLLREEIDYLRELTIGDVIEVDLTLLGESGDRSRFKMAHEIRRADGKSAARIVISGGWMDLAQRKLRAPPPALLAAVQAIPRAETIEELPRR